MSRSYLSDKFGQKPVAGVFCAPLSLECDRDFFISEEKKMKKKHILLLAAIMSVNGFYMINAAEDNKNQTDKYISESTESGAAVDILTNRALDDGIYSVPVTMVQAANPKVTSMGNDALDGNAVISIKNGKTEITLNFKAVVKTGLYGHLLKLWSYPEADEMNYDWWNTDVETPAESVAAFTDFGMNYPLGDTSQSEFVKSFRITRNTIGEEHIFVRVSVDTMAGFDQPARLDFDWDNAVAVNYAEVTTETTTSTETTTYTETTTIAQTISETATETTTASVPRSSSGGGSGSSKKTNDTYEDGKYWMTFHLWNEHLDQASMGDAAFENNRQALVTVSGNGKKAKVEIASNPVAVSGYTSALQDIISDDVSISIDEKENFTTNTRYDGTEHTFQRIVRFSFDLDNTSTEYVSVKINTPYTPMDNISENEGGFIAARLKLDWSSLSSAGENARLSSNSSVASGSSSSSGNGGSVNETDTETGIQIKADEYVFPDSTTFKTEQFKSGEDYDTAKALINSDEFRLFTIKAENSDKEVSPDGVAEVYFPVLDTDKNVKIYRINKETKTQEAGAVELEYKLSSDKKYYVITVKEFGLFAIAKTDEEMNVEIKDNELGLVEDTVYAAAPTESGFTDISDHWAKNYILKAIDKGLFNGVSENKFAPDVYTTRAMFVTVLGRLDGIEEKTNKSSKFTDIKDTDYFYPYVVWASENGIVSGISNTIFAPYEPVTREQMCTMLYNYARYKGISFKPIYKMAFNDTAYISDYAKDAVSELADAGIISGRPNGIFDPKGTATRAEIATMLVNFTDEYMKEGSEEEVSEDPGTESETADIKEIENAEDTENSDKNKE